MTDNPLSRLRELEQEATPGPWEWDDNDDCMRLLSYGPPDRPAKRQILKAPKRNTPYVEYWPDEGDAALILALRNSAKEIIELIEACQSFKFDGQGASFNSRDIEAVANARDSLIAKLSGTT